MVTAENSKSIGAKNMSRLEDLQPNAAVRGILPDALVTVVSVQWFGSEALELTYKNAAGKIANELLYRGARRGVVGLGGARRHFRNISRAK